MSIHALNRFLVKIPTALDATTRGALPSGTDPLFPDERSGRGVDAVRDPQWFLHTPATDALADAHPWDAAHEVVRSFRSVVRTESADVYAEPDLIHRRYATVRASDPGTPAASGPWPASKGQIPDYPPPDNASFSLGWHLDYAGFPIAWKIATGANVRIAHLDTGYYPAHKSTPVNMRRNEGWNYYDGNNHVDDPGHHLNAGHGTATLALLAGGDVDLQYTSKSGVLHTYAGKIGGAYDAVVVPVRIGGIFGSVVHLYSSSMAQGLHHALGVRGQRDPCDVVTLSHGGLPTKAWVDQVNNLYDAGIVLAAASGDSFSAKWLDIPTHFCVYPSAWWRVITVTGETFGHAPYTTDHFGVVEGSWGPIQIMPKALGGYTPNVPWMRLGYPTAWEMDGSGTSAATPQVAAACALWMSLYPTLPKDWRRVMAVRYMLLESVTDKMLNFPKIGRGALSAAQLLGNPTLSNQIALDAQKTPPLVLKQIAPDECSWPFWRILFGLPPPGPGTDEMLETEALQLAYRSTNRRLHEAMETYDQGRGLPPRLAKTLREEFIREPDMSHTLHAYLLPHL